MNRGGDHLRLIERAHFMIEIYEKRRKVAELYYGKKMEHRRAIAARNQSPSVQSTSDDAFDLK